jgi:hypothetical protein
LLPESPDWFIVLCRNLFQYTEVNRELNYIHCDLRKEGGNQ